MRSKLLLSLIISTYPLLSLLSGCQGVAFSIQNSLEDGSAPTAAAIMEAPVIVAPMKTYNHVWQKLSRFDAVKDEYGLYTYVLTNRSASDNIASNRFNKLVYSIENTTSEADLQLSKNEKGTLNVFLIPYDKYLASVDQELAKRLLLSLSINSKRDFPGAGPYLFTIHKPIQLGKSNELIDILYVDLSNMHEKAFDELIKVYKTSVTDSNFHGLQKLSSFKISLLNSMLVAEDSIKFIKTAEASFYNAFKLVPKK